MILVDTSVWIDFFRGREPNASELAGLLDGGQVYTIEPIFGELLQGCRNKAETARLMSYWRNTPRIAHPELLIAAGQFSALHRLAARGLALTDSAILFVSEESRCYVWSLDKTLMQHVPTARRFEVIRGK